MDWTRSATVYISIVMKSPKCGLGDCMGSAGLETTSDQNWTGFFST